MGRYVSIGAVSQSAVARSQQFLKTQGFDPGPIDGDAGPLTIAAQQRYASAVVSSCQAGGGPLGAYVINTGARLVAAGQIQAFQTGLRGVIGQATPGTASYNKVNDFLQYAVVTQSASANPGGAGPITLPSVPDVLSTKSGGINPFVILFGVGIAGWFFMRRPASKGAAK